MNIIIRKELTPQQKAAKELIRCDLQYLFTILQQKGDFNSNYIISMMPYLGLVVGGAEAWLRAMSHTHSTALDAPNFTPKQKIFYDAVRQSIKLWELPYEDVYTLLKNSYTESDAYFSSCCKPIAKHLRLYDIFGADLTDDGHFFGNTILGAVYLPGYNHSDSEYGVYLQNMAVIGGNYIPFFDAMESYEINTNLHFHYRDYGGFVKSPVGNKFSQRFILFSILCQVNFIVYAVDKYILPEIPAKLRFAYILYYYLCDVLPKINTRFGTSFFLNHNYYSQEFRNAMAHYKVGVYLKAGEIVTGDPLFGMTQKAFVMDFFQMKKVIIRELSELSNQLECYLKLK